MMMGQSTPASSGGGMMGLLRQPSDVAPPAGSSPMPPMGGGAPQAAPSHAQTVAALRHFAEMQRHLKKLVTDPNLGRANMRPKVIEALTDLMSNRFMSLLGVMNELKTLPDAPADQKKWIEQHFRNAILAQQAVLNHHVQGSPPLGDPASEAQNMTPPPQNGEGGADDAHIGMMDGLMAHYKQRRA